MLSKPQFTGERVPLTNLCSPKQWKTIPKSSLEDSGYPVYGANGIIGHYHDFNHAEETILIGCRGTCGQINVCPPQSYVTGNAMALDSLSDRVSLNYLEAFLRTYDFDKVIGGTSQPQITKQGLAKIMVPVPSLEEQVMIESKLQSVNSIKEAATHQLSLFDDLVKSRFDEMFGDPVNSNKWPRYKIGDVYAVKSSKRIYAKKQTRTGIPFYRLADINTLIDNGHANSKIYISEDTYAELASNDQVPLSGDILVTARGTLGRCYVIAPSDCFYFQDGMITWLSRKEVSPLPTYLVSVFKNAHFIDSLRASCSGTTVRYLSIFDLANTTIPLPPIALQEEFVDFVSCTDKSRFISMSRYRDILIKNGYRHSHLQDFNR